MEQNKPSNGEPHNDDDAERDAVRNAARENGLYSLVFYGSKPWIALVDRDESPSTSHALPGERIAIVEWMSEEVGYVNSGWGVSITNASERQTNPEWEMPEKPDKTFDDRKKAVAYATEQLQDWKQLAEDLNEQGGVPEKRAEAVALVEHGYKYAEAAEKLGIDSKNPRSQIGNHIKKYRERDYRQAAWLVENGPDV